MRKLGKVFAHIPARGGSKRVLAKNLRYLVGNPLLTYAITCAISCNIFDEIYVNTDSDEIEALAIECGARVYKRNASLASDQAKGDDFTADFIVKKMPDTLVMISPVCPFVEPEDVLLSIDAYKKSDCDTLITCQQTQMQTFCGEKPVNIDIETSLVPTQENSIVKILNWAVTIWDAKTFLESYRNKGYGYIGTRRLLLPLDPLKCLKISNEQDFRLAELIMRARQVDSTQFPAPSYWKKSKHSSIEKSDA